MMSQMFDLALICLLHMLHNLNCEWVENKGLWYYISAPDLSVNYDKAVDICDSLNARLAVITDEDQNTFLKENIEDGECRWIGLSNDKNTTLYAPSHCSNAVYVWNKDWYCDITYSNFDNDNHKKRNQINCSGVAFRNGKWTAIDCSELHGFICQWECKRIYMNFEGGVCSGVYTFDNYYNGNLDYYKERDRHCAIYVSKSLLKWVTSKWDNYRSTYNVEYVHESDLYVPYTKGMSWKAFRDREVIAGSFCVDCDRLNICLYPRHGVEVCLNDMQLMSHSKYPEYSNSDSTAVFKFQYFNKYYTYCMRTEDIGKWCEYIFPYPKKTTIYTDKTHYKLSITNECTRDDIKIPTTTVPSPPAQSTVSLPSQTSSATLEQKSTQNNKIITLSVSIAAVVIAIIIVAVIVSIIFVRRRKQKGQNDEDPGGINIRNDTTSTAQYNNNVYLELPEPNSKMNIEDLLDNDSNGREYSYADFATPGARQASTEIVKIPRLEGKPSNFEVAQNKGYLVPDHGVFMDINSKQADNGHMDNKQETHAVYSQTIDSNSRVKSTSPSPGESESDYDLQLHENEVYDASADGKLPNNPKTENVYYNDVNANVESGINPQTKPKHNSNENCPNKYVVSDSIDEGDDLELFENSVYEHNQR